MSASVPGLSSKKRDRIFQEFHQRTGLKPFGPDFVDSAVAVMRDPESCLSERTLVWTKWRAWGNSSESPVSDWDPEHAPYALDQTDCALDLAWFAEGRTVEWVEGAPREYRERARTPGRPERPRRMIPKQRISEAFAKNQARDTVHTQGHRIVPVISPAQTSGRKVRAPRTFENDEAFLSWWKSTGTSDFENWEVTRRQYFEAREVARCAYRTYRKSVTSGDGNLIEEVIASPNSSCNGEENRGAAADAASVGIEKQPEQPGDSPPFTPPLASCNGSGQRTASTAAVACIEPEIVQAEFIDPDERSAIPLYSQWVALRSLCKKPVNDKLDHKCRSFFLKYPIAEQRRIIADTTARIESWNAEKKLDFIPGPLDYLRSRVWETDPVQTIEQDYRSGTQQRRDRLAEKLLRDVDEKGL